MQDFVRLSDINFQRINHNEFGFFMNRVAGYMKECGPEALHIDETELDYFYSRVDVMTDVTSENIASILTPQIRSLILQQRRLLSYLRMSCKNMTKFLKGEKHSAARSLLFHLAPNIRIYDVPQGQLVILIFSVLQSLREEPNAQRIIDLKLLDVVNQLEQNNIELEQLIMKRSKSNIREESEKAKNVRAELVKLYSILSSYIWAQSVVNPSDELHNFIRQLNKLIADTYEAYHRRRAQSRRAKKKVTDESEGDSLND